MRAGNPAGKIFPAIVQATMFNTRAHIKMQASNIQFDGARATRKKTQTETNHFWNDAPFSRNHL